MLKSPENYYNSKIITVILRIESRLKIDKYLCVDIHTCIKYILHMICMYSYMCTYYVYVSVHTER